MKSILVIFVFSLLSLSCAKDNGQEAQKQEYWQKIEDELPKSDHLSQVTLTTNKSRYVPGETVIFSGSNNQSGLAARVWYLGSRVDEFKVDGCLDWEWIAPNTDFRGYLVELIGKDMSGKICRVGSVAVDVSSDWTRFPRYGFLSHFDNVDDSGMRKVISNLNKHHINALQYYEWAYDHHHPLAGTPENPEKVWPKLLSTMNCELDVIRGYIEMARTHGIASMFYNLCNGTMAWGESDGVDKSCYTYKDASHVNKDCHPLDPPFRSSLYLTDPGNANWLDYISPRTDDVYKVFDFDGFHIDQLGNRGTVYDYSGKVVDLPAGYKKFIDRMKADNPNKILAFNAVSEYGQEQIAKTDVSFFYNEVWEHQFRDLKNVVDHNIELDPGKNTVLAAYMNYNTTGYFNTPSILLADAVMFALGASHIELGEHMMSYVYWPSKSNEMTEELKKSLVYYYDFLVAYENLLRDGADYSILNLSCADPAICNWGPEKGKVNTIVKQKDGKYIIHLINFSDATHLDWCDAGKTQAEPKEIKNFNLNIYTSKKINRIWVASPDIDGGTPRNVKFYEGTGMLTVEVPYLKYWTMIVVE